MNLTNFQKIKNGLYQAINIDNNDIIEIKKNVNTFYWDTFINNKYSHSHTGLKWAKAYLYMV